jgi:hypothetical protein
MSSPHIHTTWGRGNRPLQARPGLRLALAGEIARYLGAVSVLLVGAVHAQQYYVVDFSALPTIGTLFLLNFVGAGVVGAVLMAPVRRFGRNTGDLILILAALGAIGIAFGSLVSLIISEYTPFFGFMESGYRQAVVLSLVFDALTTVFLGVFVVAVARTRQHRDTSPTRPATRTEERVTSSRGAPATGAGRHRRGSATRATNASPAAIHRVHPGRTRR